MARTNPLDVDAKIAAAIRKHEEADPIAHGVKSIPDSKLKTPGGTSGAPIDGLYLCLALNAVLDDERRFVPGLGLSATDGGPNNDYDLACLLATGAQAGVVSLAAQTLGAGNKTFKNAVILTKGSKTIDANDEITVPTTSWVYLTSAGATDNLDGIGAGVEGQIAILTPTAGKDITLVHDGTVTTGKKLMINGEANVTLNQDHDLAIAIYDATATVWNVMVPGSGGGGISELWTAVTAQTLTAGSTITVTDGEPWRQIQSASAITLTSEPHIAAGRNGQVVHLHNTGNYNITLQDVNALGGSLMRFTANTLTIQPGGTLGLTYDSGIGFWVETFLLNPQSFTPSIATFTCDLSATREVAAATTEDSLPDFELTYIGTPSACSIDVQTGSHPGGNYPISVPSPYTDLDSGTTPPSDTWYRGSSVLATVVMRATATVAGQSGLTKDLTFTYYNRRYCGPSSDGGQLTSAEILALDATAAGESGLSNSKYATFTDIDTGVGEYIYICYRSALGTVSYFSIENEIAAFTSEGIMSHTNDLGFVENFQQYRSNLTNFGNNKDVRTLSSQPNNRIYIGPHTDTQIDSDGILELDDTADGESIVSNTVARTYTDIEVDAGEYLWLCHPDRVADLNTIKDGTTGFGIDGEYKTNVTHVNQYGYSETYRCWRSTNPGIYPDGENIVVT